LKEKIIIGILALGIGLSLCLGFGLYLMEIEDHYGDLQELYYEAQTGNIIVNEADSKFGVLTKSWRRLTVKSNIGSAVDLYEWVYGDDKEASVTILKSNKKEVDFSKLQFDQVKKMIENGVLIYVTSN